MAWTWPTATFFIAIAVMLVVMTIVELKWPGVERRGFLPLVTSRGDRLFISLLTAAYLQHAQWQLDAYVLQVDKRGHVRLMNTSAYYSRARDDAVGVFQLVIDHAQAHAGVHVR